MSCDIRHYKFSGRDPGEMDMRLTAFMGGKDRGAYCVQFTIGHNFCQLSERAVVDLIKTLSSRLLCAEGFSATGAEREDIIFKEKE